MPNRIICDAPLSTININNPLHSFRATANLLQPLDSARVNPCFPTRQTPWETEEAFVVPVCLVPKLSYLEKAFHVERQKGVTPSSALPATLATTRMQLLLAVICMGYSILAVAG